MPQVDRRPEPGKRVIQSYVFPAEWGLSQVRSWLKGHEAFAGGLEETGSGNWRARQFNPEDFDSLTFRMVSIGTDGVKAVFGRARG